MTLIMAAGLMGILLIGIAPMLKTGGGKPKAQQEPVPSAEEYAAALERRLEGILGKIDGVGEVEVMITVKSGYTYTYAMTEKVNSDVSEEYKSDDQRKTQQKNTTEQSYVMVEDGDSPLVTALNEPEIKGVVVVCGGGGDPRVVSEVITAVKTALDISTAKITVSRISPGTAGS
jgi:hypothetical protein